MLEANSVINFDRCCHLVFENTDLLLKDHGEAFKHLVELYHRSCKRIRDDGIVITRQVLSTLKFCKSIFCYLNLFLPQIVACSEHWTKGMKILLDRVMQRPCLFISSCLEAAIYGGMELDVRRGISSEMDGVLLKIVEKKKETRTVVFCRSYDEIAKLQAMLSTVFIPRMKIFF